MDIDKKEKRLKENKEYKEKNKLKLKEKTHLRYLKNKKDILKKNKEYRLKNIEKRRLNRQRKFKENIIFRLNIQLKNKIKNILKKQNISKLINLEIFLGCTVEELKKYIESQFNNDMNWNNYKLWFFEYPFLDKTINLFDIKEQQKFFNFKNLKIKLYKNKN